MIAGIYKIGKKYPKIPAAKLLSPTSVLTATGSRAIPFRKMHGFG